MPFKIVTTFVFLLLSTVAARAQVTAEPERDESSRIRTSQIKNSERPSPFDLEPAPSSPANNPARAQIQNSNETDTAQPLTEFQKFIYGATGEKLDMFGYKLFSGVPSTFAPVDRVPVTADYVIGPGDEIQLRGWGQVDIDYHAVVDRMGNLFIPKVGNINVAGIKFSDLQPYIKSSIHRVFQNFDLNVSLGQLRSIQIFVVGQAKRPGSYTVSSLSSLVNAIFASGGPSELGSMRKIALKRGGKTVTEFDLYDLLLKGDKSKDAPLLPGDVVFIPAIGPTVAIIGSVNAPAIYELSSNPTLDDLLKFAGGLTSTASGPKASVERITNRKVRTIEEFPLDESGIKRGLKDGDLVTIRALSARFDNAIVIRGNVTFPGRYAWHQAMRVNDIISNKEFLITRAYWSTESNLAREEPSSVKAPEIARVPGEAKRELNGAVGSSGQSKLSDEIKRTAPDINWDYAVIQRLDSEHLTTSLIPFNLLKAINGDASENQLLQPGDVITIFSQEDLRTTEAKRKKFVRLEGEFITSGVYEALPEETLQQMIARVGGVTQQAYLYGAEFTRESVREDQQKKLDEFVDRLDRDVERSASTKSQNVVSAEEALTLKDKIESQRRLIEKLKLIKASGRVVLGIRYSNRVTELHLPDIVLEDGDRLFIPSRPATVNVVGAVFSDSSFLYQVNANAGYYLRKSGGGTPNADNSHTFVVRADGSIVSKTHSNGWVTGNFGSLKIMPGDTIVVPERLDKTSVLKGLKDWSQVVGQLALGAAAVRTLSP